MFCGLTIFNLSIPRYMYMLQSYFQVLMYGNSATNPVLYAFLGDQFKRGFKRAIRGGSQSGFSPQRTLSSRMSSFRWNGTVHQFSFERNVWKASFQCLVSKKMWLSEDNKKGSLPDNEFSDSIFLHCWNEHFHTVIARTEFKKINKILHGSYLWELSVM